MNSAQVPDVAGIHSIECGGRRDVSAMIWKDSWTPMCTGLV